MVDPSAAGGVFSLLWLIIALPALGAAVILLLGNTAYVDAGRTCSAARRCSARSCSAWSLFVALLGRDADDRQVGQHLYTWVDAGSFKVDLGLLYDPLSALFLLLITGVGSLIHIYSVGYMEHDERRRPVLRLPQPVRRRDADAGARRQLPRRVPRLGGRRPRVVPADRLLAAQALRRGRRQEGVRRQPRR